MFGLLTRPSRKSRRHAFSPSLEQAERRALLSVAISNLQIRGDQACTTFTNTGTTVEKVAVASYGLTTTAMAPQVYLTSQIETLKPGESVEICLPIDCNYPGMQYDAFRYDKSIGQVVIKEFNHFPDYSVYPDDEVWGTIIKVSDHLDCDCECPEPSKVKGNEGLGNGVDPPPPGHAKNGPPFVQNDDPGHGPGNPNKGFNKKN